MRRERKDSERKGSRRIFIVEAWSKNALLLEVITNVCRIRDKVFHTSIIFENIIQS